MVVDVEQAVVAVIILVRTGGSPCFQTPLLVIHEVM